MRTISARALGDAEDIQGTWENSLCSALWSLLGTFGTNYESDPDFQAFKRSNKMPFL